VAELELFPLLMRSPLSDEAEVEVSAPSVFGLVISDDTSRVTTRRALRCSLVLFVWYMICLPVFFITHNGLSNTIIGVGVVMSVIIPCSGYVGIRKNDKFASFLFCGCSCAFVILTAFILFLLALLLSSVHHEVRDCNPSDTTIPSCPNADTWKQLCTVTYADMEDATPQECYDYLKEHLSTISSVIIACMLIAAPALILELLCWWWSQKLYNKLRVGTLIHTPVYPVITSSRRQP